MKKINVIDDFLDNETWHKCLELLASPNWQYATEFGIDTEYSKIFRIIDPEVKVPLTLIMVNAIQKYFGVNNVTVKRLDINGSTMGTCSNKHVDGGPDNWSLVWFANTDWLPEYGGQLLIYNDPEAHLQEPIIKEPDLKYGVEEIPYRSNRAVLFRSHLVHFPLPQTHYAVNRFRMSLGLHFSCSIKESDGLMVDGIMRHESYFDTERNRKHD